MKKTAVLCALLACPAAFAQATPDRQERLKDGMRATLECARDYAARYISTTALPQDVADAAWARCGGSVSDLSMVARQAMGDENASAWFTKMRSMTRDTAILVVLEGRFPPKAH